MRFLPATLLALLSAGLAAADDLVTKGRIKVQLFAAPAFVSEVSVDAYDNQCLSLDNNLCVIACVWAKWSRVLMQPLSIDGRVQSLLVGGHDVATVLGRDDYWNCRFFEYGGPSRNGRVSANVGSVTTTAPSPTPSSPYPTA
ncbi:hypothetical protein BDU57DRAFT_522343 [Ampelomyces quisqualis]|uniref:Uncharacterized protein n=1 Tax=Ampelomyces quisqualis TaxID=50730 RepID=A0A6A5QDM2_AMPQU|nr:hypothetical protein BDU57DRAFT_522343 [Ampelomyces quisqualis]